MSEVIDIIARFSAEAEIDGLKKLTSEVKNIGKDGKAGLDNINQSVKNIQDSIKGIDLKKVFSTKEIDTLEKSLSKTTDEFEQLNLVSKQFKEKLGTLAPESQEFKTLSEVVNLTENTLNEFNKAQTETGKGATSLKGRLREMQAELTRLEEQGLDNTKQFKDLQLNAGKLKDAIGDTAQRVKVLSSDTKYIDFGVSSVQALTNAVQIGAGAFTLFGASEEDAAEATAKLTALMNVAVGLQSLTNLLQKQGVIQIVGQELATKALTVTQGLYNSVLGTSSVALKAFKVALISTGIGAIIVAVGLLIANWEDLTKAISGSNKELELTKKVNDDVSKSFAETEASILKVDTAFKLASQGTLRSDEALKIYNDTVGDAIGKANSLSEAEKLYAENKQFYIDAQFAKAEATAYLSQVTSLYEEQIKNAGKSDADFISFTDKLKVAVKTNSVDVIKELLFGGDKIKKTYKKIAQDNRTESTNDINSRLNFLKEGYKKSFEQQIIAEAKLSKGRSIGTSPKSSNTTPKSNKPTPKAEDPFEKELKALENSNKAKLLEIKKYELELAIIDKDSELNKKLLLEKELRNDIDFLNKKKALQEKYNRDTKETDIQIVNDRIRLLDAELNKLQSVLALKEIPVELDLTVKPLDEGLIQRAGESFKKANKKPSFLDDYLEDPEALKTELINLVESIQTTVFNLIDTLYQKQIDAIDNLIDAQGERVQQAREDLQITGEAVYNEEKEQLRELTREREQLLRRQAKANAIAQASAQLLAIAQAAALPPPANIAAIGLVLSLLANAYAQVKTYEKGTMNAPAGMAIVDEKGAELHLDKHGNIKSLGSDRGANFRRLEQGDKIIPAHKSKDYLRSMIQMPNIEGSKQIDNRKELNEVATNTKQIVNRLDNLTIEKNIWDENGYNRFRQKRADRLNKINKLM